MTCLNECVVLDIDPMVNQCISSGYITKNLIDKMMNCISTNTSSLNQTLHNLNIITGMSIYKLRQLYHYQLDNIFLDNDDKDPDYMPYLHRSFQSNEMNDEMYSELDDLDKDPDYIPSNEDISSSEDEHQEFKTFMANNLDNTETTSLCKWTHFITAENLYKKFMSNEEAWVKCLEQVKKYIDENDKLPSRYDEINENKRLGVWIDTQQKNHKSRHNIMKNKEIYNTWTEFNKSESFLIKEKLFYDDSDSEYEPGDSDYSEDEEYSSDEYV